MTSLMTSQIKSTFFALAKLKTSVNHYVNVLCLSYIDQPSLLLLSVMQTTWFTFQHSRGKVLLRRKELYVLAFIQRLIFCFRSTTILFLHPAFNQTSVFIRQLYSSIYCFHSVTISFLHSVINPSSVSI